MTRKDFLAVAGGVAAALATSRSVFAQMQNQTPPPTGTRPEVASARNIQKVRQALGNLIGQLEHDQRDYGGWRMKAIRAMRQAREDLQKALEWDATHPQ